VPKDTTLSNKELAANYGYTMAVLKSDPELERIFKAAAKHTWSVERFQAAVQNSKWFKHNAASVRDAKVMKASDPATYAAKVQQVRTRLVMQASALGATLSGKQLADMAEHAYMYGWDDNQIQRGLSHYIKYTDGRHIGQAGQWDQELRSYAQEMGVKISDRTMGRYVEGVAAGRLTIEDAKGRLAQTAISAFPHLKDRILAGETLSDIADPYQQTMSSLLELNPDSLSMNDPMIRKALAVKGEDGKVGLSTLYDFENQVRGDSRWLKTQQAQDSVMSTAHKVLADFGLLGG
jgi:LysM repeat protein